jgi:zinc transport system substrate-binding protein
MGGGFGVRVFHLIVLTVFMAVASRPAVAGPSVLATIKPVHSLVAAVMQGTGSPHLLVRGAQSEHSYALRPSDLREIEQASIIFEIGPNLETYLARALKAHSPKAVVVSLKDAIGVHLLRARRGGLWEGGNDAGEGDVDPHIWLDPENAIAMTRAIATGLTTLNPGHGKIYRANADREIQALTTLEHELKKRLAPLRGRPYLVFHDGYRYFENRFGLTPIGAVTVAPDRPVGARRIERLRLAILANTVECVFREPQFEPRLIQSLVSGSRAQTGILDPVGADLTPGPELYPTLLRRLAISLSTCMAEFDKNR